MLKPHVLVAYLFAYGGFLTLFNGLVLERSYILSTPDVAAVFGLALGWFLHWQWTN